MSQTQLDALAVGSILDDRYVVGKIMGSGGFGITYLAFDTELERRVAIKEYFPVGIAVRIPDRVTIASISPRLDEDFTSGRERFYNEADILRRLGSDIVKVYDVFSANGTVYYAMEYVNGLTVTEYVKKHGRISAEQAMYAALELSDAFTFIHEKGIIHRDLTPDNIIITNDGGIKIVDFGNARPFSIDGENSLTDALKPGYAPLEQYQHYGRQGPWTDIYSLGAVLFFALTLDDPRDPMTRIEDDSDFRDGLAYIDAQLAALIGKMANIRIEERYADGRELSEALKDIHILPRKFRTAE